MTRAQKKKGGPHKKGRRRARFEGSLYKRASDGRYVATLVVGVNEHGRPKYKVFYGLTESEALQKKKDFEIKMAKGHVSVGADAKQTLAQYLDSWVEVTRLSDGTRKRYRELIKYRIKPSLGGYQLGKLDKAAIKGWLTWLKDLDAEPRSAAMASEDGHQQPDRLPAPRTMSVRSPRQKQKVTPRGQEMALRVLNKALNDAEQEDVIPANPLRKVKVGRPRALPTTARSMTPAQVGAFLKASPSDAYHTLYLLALDSGMREGELFALEWDDINLDAGTVTIRRDLEELGGKVTVGETKTPKSRRTIMLARQTVAALKTYRRNQVAGGNQTTLVFTAPEGGYLRRPNLAQRFFQPMLKRAGLPRFKFHELRHTCASLLLMAGVNIKVVSERLGHASVDVTLKTYAHVLPGMQQHAAEKMDEVLEAARRAALSQSVGSDGQTEAAKTIEAVLDQISTAPPAP